MRAKTRAFLRGISVLMPFAMIACGEAASDGPTDPFTRYEVGEPEVRIGSVDDPDFAFGAVEAAAVGPDGALYTTHATELAIRRWDPEGRPAGTVGREGDGPGEFRRLAGFGFFGDSLWVWDRASFRASWFGLDGTLLGSSTPTVRLEATPSMEGMPPRPEQPTRAGQWYGKTPASTGAMVTGELTRLAHVVLDHGGRVLDTLWVQDARPTDFLSISVGQGRNMYGPQPFPDMPLTAVSSDETLVVVDRRAWDGQGEPGIRLLRLSFVGDTLLDVELPYAAEPLPQQRTDSVVSVWAENVFEFFQRVQPGTSLGDLERMVADAIYRPAYLPAVRAMLVADDGRVWLQRFDAEGDHDVWWVISKDGRQEGEVLLPGGMRPVWVRDDRLWAVETDEFDVNYLVRLTVRPVG